MWNNSITGHYPEAIPCINSAENLYSAETPRNTAWQCYSRSLVLINIPLHVTWVGGQNQGK